MLKCYGICRIKFNFNVYLELIDTYSYPKTNWWVGVGGGQKVQEEEEE